MPHIPQDLLVEFVAGREVPCPVCDYSLRDLTAPVCPECGCPLELRVGSPHLRAGAWVLGIVAFALALGFDGVVSIMMITMLALQPAQNWQPFGVVSVFVALTLGMLGSLLVVVRRRTAWSRWPLRRQWATSIGIFAGVGALHGTLGAALFLLAR